MNLNRPANLKLIMRWLVIVTLLFWATQTLVAQWGFGAEVEYVPDASGVRFIATDSPRNVLLEVKDEATVFGPKVRLKHVVRCSPSDAAALEQTLELTVAKIEKPKSVLTLDLSALKRVLEENGVNLLTLHFSGAVECRVARADEPGEAQALARTQGQLRALMATTRPANGGVTSSGVSPLGARAGEQGPSRTLREILVKEAAERFSLEENDVHARFIPADEKLISLSEPGYQFEVTPRRAANIGDLTWDVLIRGVEGEKKAAITANIKVWRAQFVTARALSCKQVIRDDDLKETRSLLDRLTDEPQLAREQIVGSEATRNLPPGVVFARHMLQATQFVRPGQSITVTVERPGVRMKWEAEARESGCYGQVIKIRRWGTREEFLAKVTGEEQGLLVGSADDGVARR
jgi:flagella basal body P-ring formation protein FlgA